MVGFAVYQRGKLIQIKEEAMKDAQNHGVKGLL
jgi:hypothetical protein